MWQRDVSDIVFAPLHGRWRQVVWTSALGDLRYVARLIVCMQAWCAQLPSVRVRRARKERQQVRAEPHMMAGWWACRHRKGFIFVLEGANAGELVSSPSLHGKSRQKGGGWEVIPQFIAGLKIKAVWWVWMHVTAVDLQCSLFINHHGICRYCTYSRTAEAGAARSKLPSRTVQEGVTPTLCMLRAQTSTLQN